jgi:transitional endoplasmic reticulum ATPase
MELLLTTLLSPAQRAAADGLLHSLACGDVLLLQGEEGAGKTTILEHLRDSLDGLLVDIRQFMVKLAAREPLAVEEAFVDLMHASMAGHDLVMVDDLHLIGNVSQGCYYPRSYLLDLAINAVLTDARAKGKKLVFASDGVAPQAIRLRAYSFAISEFGISDYEAICRTYLGVEISDRLDYARIHRFAPMLNGHQLRRAALWLQTECGVDTDRFIEYLVSQNLTSNVDIEEVTAVELRDLKGVDEVVQALETKIALPFENDALAAEFQLKPKRGVLLAGPPGTGKTTIGRALAHRLKSKFFLIDGTVIAGTHEFYGEVRRVFDAAKRNAPSIIFIDDADVLFEEKAERGFYRYLLTMLDGLESASAERVCVIMTAMDAASLPEAVLRSGRVELWLETRLPDEHARAEILVDMLSTLPEPLSSADVTRIASSSRGLSGADLKAVVEDGKLLFAHDKLAAAAVRPAESYFVEAIETIRKNRRTYLRKKPTRLAETVKVGFKTE